MKYKSIKKYIESKGGKITRMIRDDEECVGKYRTKKKANDIAKMASHTGAKFIPIPTHYYSNTDMVACWTIILER